MPYLYPSEGPYRGKDQKTTTDRHQKILIFYQVDDNERQNHCPFFLEGLITYGLDWGLVGRGLPHLKPISF